MPYPYDVLASASLPAVTNIRATKDYFHSFNQEGQDTNWAVGQTGLLYWALGVLPFKDGFYSSTHKQVGGQTVGPETNPDRHAIMAVLSGAMVGPMDGIGFLNVSRIMATCRSDGYVLKPDRPVTIPDYCFRNERLPEQCSVFHTYSILSGLTSPVHYHFNNFSEALTPDMVSLKSPTGYVVYNWYTGDVVPLSESTELTPGYEGHGFAIVTPVQAGWAFIGEVNKYATASGLRFSSVAVYESAVNVVVKGLAGEKIRVCAAHLVGNSSSRTWTKICSSVSFTRSATKTVRLVPALRNSRINQPRSD
jgi:hypothetical protein